jgi:hypothetical protein
MALTEFHEAIKIKAGVLGTAHSATSAANLLAGTNNWEMVGALNVIAGNDPSHYQELTGVLNQLAGTTGWGENAAASRWAGLY